MFRSIPVSNKICFDKQLKRNWKIHERKLSEMKSKLSKQKSQQFTFLQQDKKHNVLKDIKNRQIQRSNHILFKRIQQIQKKGTKNSYINIGGKHYHTKLLHEQLRKKEMIKIFQENQDLLRRIKDKKSAYNVKKMQMQRKNIQKNICLISEFQYKNYPQTHTKCNLYAKQDKYEGCRSILDSNKQNQSFRNTSQEPRCKTTAKFRPRGINKLFHQSTRQINGQNYIITTYTHKSIFYIQVQNQENHLDKYRMQMTQDQVNKLLQIYYQDQIQVLVNSLQIDSKKQSCYLKFKKSAQTSKRIQHEDINQNQKQ